MKRFRLASLIVAAALVPAAAAMAQTGNGTGSGSNAPPPTRPGGGSDEGLRGPRVPGQSGEGNRDFRGGERRPGAPGRGGPVADERAWMAAFEKIQPPLSEEQQTQVKAFREEYQLQVKAWQEAHGAEFRELQQQVGEARRSGKEPDPAVAEKLKKVQESRPKAEGMQRRVMGVLTAEQRDSHKKLMDEAMQQRGNRGRGPAGADRPAPPPGDGDRPPRGERPGRGQRPPPPPPPPAKDPME